MADKFSFNTKDKHGITPIPELVGAVIQHANGKPYTIVNYIWMGATDEWGFRHISPEGVECARPLSHLLSTRANGMPRYALRPRDEQIARLFNAKIEEGATHG